MTNKTFKAFFALTTLVAAYTQAEVPQGYFTDVRNVGPVSGTRAFDFIPAVSPDGLTLYFSDTSTNNPPIPGNLGEEDMWMATRSSVDEKFSNVMNLGPGVNSPAFEDMGSVSPDGSTLYFGSNRSGNWDLYQATLIDGAFGNVQSLGTGVNTNAVENSPRITPDGKTLVYHTRANLSPGSDHDVWIATRQGIAEPFGNARSLQMNTGVSDLWPSLSSDGLTLFTSDWTVRPPRPGGEGGEDIWVSTRPSVDEPFGSPVNPDELWPGSDINSRQRIGTPFISQDWPAPGSKLYWGAQGPGGISGNLDIFQATWVPEPSSLILVIFGISGLLARNRKRR